MNEKDKHISLIFKYLAKEASEEEFQSLKTWIEESGENRSLFHGYKDAWDFSDHDFLSEINNIDVDDEWNTFRQNTDFDDIKFTPAKKENKRLRIGRIAAVISLILVLGIVSVFISQPKQEIIYAELEIKDSKLPDGSEITINKHSTVEYTDKYNQKNRKVELKGDAFFKVAKNDSLPFIIDAQSFFVEVLGTEFYVNSDFKDRKVIVKEGTVAVYKFKDKRDKVILTTGEEIIFDKKSNELRKIESLDINYLSWKTKEFKFKDTELEEVFSELEKVYNIQFEFINPELKECTLVGEFLNQEIDEIINVLQATFHNLSFKRNNNIIFVDGEACNSF